MTQTEFEDICREAFDIFKEYCPVDTGNMKYNASVLKIEQFEGEIRIRAEIAPYSVYTNIDWGLTSPYWMNSTKYPMLNGVRLSSLYNSPLIPKNNPNEGWIDKAVKAIAERIAARLKGTLE